MPSFILEIIKQVNANKDAIENQDKVINNLTEVIVMLASMLKPALKDDDYCMSYFDKKKVESYFVNPSKEFKSEHLRQGQNKKTKK